MNLYEDFQPNKTIILIPAYQPDEKLVSLCRELANNNYDVVVVDDGSEGCDNIFTTVSTFTTVIGYSRNHGKGYALKTGLNYIKKHYTGDYIVVTADADGQHSLLDIGNVSIVASTFPNALILGGRKFTGKVPFKSKFGNTITRYVFRLKTGCRIYDTQTGLRAFSNRLISKMIDISGNRYEYEMEMLLHCASHNIPIIEEEIETIYIDDNSSSHFHPLKDSWRIYRVILGARLSKHPKSNVRKLNSRKAITC